mmetsp:Transcript_23690/g.42907  ORF Transcript_23690/g.42907 Transcript_23690/m.42907 type:complete len:258 (+) Transcript_23690:117-890(+)
MTSTSLPDLIGSTTNCTWRLKSETTWVLCATSFACIWTVSLIFARECTRASRLCAGLCAGRCFSSAAFLLFASSSAASMSALLRSSLAFSSAKKSATVLKPERLSLCPFSMWPPSTPFPVENSTSSESWPWTLSTLWAASPWPKLPEARALCLSRAECRMSSMSTRHFLRSDPASMSALGCRSISKQLFISAWKWSRGRSLASCPNGFSSSTPMKFKAAIPKTGTKEKIAHMGGLSNRQVTIIGMLKQLMNSKNAMS